MRSSPVAKKSKPLEDISKDENVQSNNQKNKKKKEILSLLKT